MKTLVKTRPNRLKRDERHGKFSSEEQACFDALLTLYKSNPRRIQPIVSRFLAQGAEDVWVSEEYKAKHAGDISSLIRRQFARGELRRAAVPTRPPGDDHGVLLYKDRIPAVYLSEPYGLWTDRLRDIVEFCDKYRLEVSFNASQGIWNPGCTTTLMYRAREKVNMAIKHPLLLQYTRVQLSVDGDAGMALLGANIQEGESEFVDVEQLQDEALHDAQVRACFQAFQRLKNRLNRTDLSYFWYPVRPGF